MYGSSNIIRLFNCFSIFIKLKNCNISYTYNLLVIYLKMYKIKLKIKYINNYLIKKLKKTKFNFLNKL